MAITGKKYKIGLVGAGRMGERWAEVINKSPVTELSIVVEPNEEVGKKIASRSGATYLPGFPEKDVSVDAFFIVTPHAYLYQNATSALQSNKPVFIEKPGARNSAELEKLVALAKNRCQPLMIGFNYRYFDNIMRAKKVIDTGTLGDILFMRLSHGHHGRKGYEKEWRMDKKISGGGVLMDQGVHLIDLVSWFIGKEINELSAVSQNLFWRSEVEEYASIILRNSKKQIASINVGVTDWKPIFSMEIIGKNGYVLANGLGRKYGKGEFFTLGLKNNDGSFTEKTDECDPEPKNALNGLLYEFVRFIETGETSGPTGEDAVTVLRTVERIYKVLNKKR